MTIGRKMHIEFDFQEKGYFSYLDEKYFYAWLAEIDGFESIKGTPKGMFVTFKGDALSLEALCDLVALFTRYGYTLGFLTALIPPDHQAFFRDRSKYWYNALFGHEA